MTLSEVSVETGMLCMFPPYQFELVGGMDAWRELYVDYTDMSGAAETREVEILGAIHNIDCRMVFVQGMLITIRRFLKELNIIHTPAIASLRNKSIFLRWEGDIEEFLEQVDDVEEKENAKVAERDRLERELKGLKNGEEVKPMTRRDFVKMLINISKHNGYALDRKATMMEDLAIMVKNYQDEAKAQKEKQ